MPDRNTCPLCNKEIELQHDHRYFHGLDYHTGCLIRKLEGEVDEAQWKNVEPDRTPIKIRSDLSSLLNGVAALVKKEIDDARRCGGFSSGSLEATCRCVRNICNGMLKDIEELEKKEG